MTGTAHLIRDVLLGFAFMVALAIAAWILIDYGAAIIIAICGFVLIALAIPIVAMYAEEHDLPFNRRP